MTGKKEKDVNNPVDTTTNPAPPAPVADIPPNAIPTGFPDEELENYDPLLSDDINVVRQAALELRETFEVATNSVETGAVILFNLYSPSGKEYKYTVRGLTGPECTRQVIRTIAAAKREFGFTVTPPMIAGIEAQVKASSTGSFPTQTVPPQFPAQGTAVPGVSTMPSQTATQTPLAPPTSPPVSGPAYVPQGATVGIKIQVTLIAHDISRNGKHYLNVKGNPVGGGKPYTEYGLSAWPEVLPQEIAGFEGWEVKKAFQPPPSMAFAFTDGKKILRFSAT